MSETNASKDSSTTQNPRRLWFFGADHIPIPASGRRKPAGVTHQAYEGDDRWTPLEETDRGRAREAGR